MPRQKVFSLNLSEDQILKLKQGLQNGAPLQVALSFAKIPPSIYFYYVELANISAYFKERELLNLEKESHKSGVVISDVTAMSQDFSSDYKNISGALHPYREPTAQSILRYKNNRSFKEMCDQVYDLMIELDQLRAEIAMYHLQVIRKSAERRNVNANASQWFLERTMPDFFGKVEKNKFEGSVDSHTTYSGTVSSALPPIKVEFVDPNTRESQDRVRDMEQKMREQLLGKDDA